MLSFSWHILFLPDRAGALLRGNARVSRDAGQLDQEMLENSWLTVPANDTLIFDTPLEERWQTASQSIGIDINQLTLLAGHC